MELYNDSRQVDVSGRGGCAVLCWVRQRLTQHNTAQPPRPGDSIANLTYFPDSEVEAMVYY